jgi:hypothetical protein
MSRAQIIARPSGLSSGALTLILVVILVAAIPLCWAATEFYGVDKGVASNLQIAIFTLVYAGILVVPWLDLSNQEHLTRAQRLEKMCVVWMCLTAAPHVTGELSYVLFYDAIMAHPHSVWTYAWWAYIDGGDVRYATHDIYIVTFETGAALIGFTLVVLLLSYRKTHRFSTNQLLVLMAAMMCDFYPTYAYYATEMWRGFPSVHGGRVDLLIKFVASNIFWLFMPWVVFIWAGRELTNRSVR